MTRIAQNPNYDNGVIGLADLTNKIIAIAEGKADISTLPEEAAHFAIELLREDPSVQRALAQVTKTEEYETVKREYADVYTKEIDFRKEALGKILAQEIINGDVQETNKPVRPFLKVIMDKLVRIFKNMLKRPTAKEEIQKILNPIAKQMLDGKVIGDAKMLENPETSTLYQKEIQIEEKVVKIEGVEYTGKPSKILTVLRKIANSIIFKELKQEDGSLTHDYIDVKTGKKIQSTTEFLSDNIEGYGISEKDREKPIVKLAGLAGSKIHNTFNSFFNNVDFGVDEATKKLIKPKLEELYLRLESQFDTIISEAIVSDGKTAGTIDLIGIKDGKVTLIDFKSMTMKGYAGYNSSYKGQLSKRDTHTAQLSKYSEMFEKVTGIAPTNLTVIPIIIDYSKTTEGPIKNMNIEDAISIKTTELPKEKEKISKSEKVVETEKEKKAKTRFLEKAISQLENRLEVMTRAVKKKESSRTLKLQIIKIKRLLEEKKLNAAIEAIINNGSNELDQIEVFLDEKREYKASNMSSRDINNIVNSRAFGMMYRDLMCSLKKDMYDFGFTSQTLDNAKKDLDTFQTRVTTVMDKATGLLESITIEKLREGNKDMYGNILDPTFDPASILERTKEDISWWRLWMGSLKNSRSNIIKIAAKKLGNILNVVHKFKVETARDLLGLQKLAQKEGNIEKLFEKDSKGHRTGYIISEYNRGKYFENLEKFKLDLAKQLKNDYYGDVVKEDLTKEELTIYNNAWKDWFKENKKIITEVKEIQGQPVAIETQVYADKYKNPDFKGLSGNMKKYYDALLATKKDSLKKQPVDYTTDDSIYLIPQIRRSFLDRMSKIKAEQSFLASIGEGLKGAVLKEDDDTMFGEVTKMNTKIVPLFFNNKLQNMAELSYDLTGAYTKYAEMGENYKQMNNISGEMQALLSTLESREYVIKGKQEVGTSSKEYRALQEFIDYTVYGKEKEEIVWKIPGTNKTINASKFLDKVTSYLRTNNLALNLTTSIAGYFKGTMDSIIEDQIGIYTTNESKNCARSEIYKNLPQVISEIGNTIQTNKMHLLLENNNVVELDRRLKNSHKNRALRKLINSDALFTNYQMADYMMKGKIALAVYDNYRLIDGKFISRHDFINMKLKEAKVEGKTRIFSAKDLKNVDQALQDKINTEWKNAKKNNKTLYDAYTAENGKLTVKEEFKEYITPALENTVHNRINHITHITDGTISAEDKGALSRKIWGDLALMHRGWVISGIDNRLKHKGMNYEVEQEEVGYYRAFGAFIGSFLKKEESGVRAKFAAWENLSEIERKGVKKTILDLAVMQTVAILGAILNNLADDDEEENFALQYLAYQSNRVLLEAKAFWSPKKFLDIMDEPVAGARLIGEIAQLGDAINFYEDSRLKSGMYKDWTKGGKYWARRSTPFKNIYELQFPAKKNRFIKSILDSPTYATMYGEGEDRSILSPIRFLESTGAIGNQKDSKD